MKQYRTDIVVETDSIVSVSLDFFGKRRINLRPKSTSYVISVWFMNYAPYEKVTYKADGSIKTKKRLGFKREFKKEDYTLKITNNHDVFQNYKIASLFSGAFVIPKGLEVVVPVHPLDSLAEWKSITVYPDKITRDLTPVLAPAGILPAQMEQDRRGQHILPNLEYKKRSRPEIQRLEDLRFKLKQNDPDVVRLYDYQTIWARDRWQITNQMVGLPSDEQRLNEQRKKRLEQEEAYANKR